MGYRSDAALVLSKEAATLLNSRLENATEDERYLFDHADMHRIDADKGDELWRWNCLKWYPEFPEVAFVNSILEELDPDDFLSVRIGESFDDIEVSGSYWLNAFNLGVVTSIVTN